MGIKCGIVGLPNVGKSTLFNALTKAGIAAANFPFCTIEPNVGVVPVPDPRLNALAEIVKPQKVHPDRGRVRRHRRPGRRRGERRGPGQQVPGAHPRGRCDHPRGALLRARGHHPRQQQGRPDRRTSRPSTPNWRWPTWNRSIRRCSAPSARPRPATRTPRRGPRCSAEISAGPECRQVRACAGPVGRGQGAGPRPVPADPQAGDVRGQRARGRLREQPAPGRRPRPGCRRGGRGGAGVGGDRGRAEPARRRRPRCVPDRPGPGRAGPEPGDPGRLQAAGPADLFHRRREGSAGLDGAGPARPRRRPPL